jgi:hypothetical protein
MTLKPITEQKLKFGEKLRLAWYFETTFEKVIILLALLSLFYSLFRIIAQGFW